MLQKMIQPEFVILFFVLVRSIDLSVTSAQGRSGLRAVFYGAVAVLAFVAVIFALLG